MASQTIESLEPVMRNLEINNENDKNMTTKIVNTFDKKWGLPLDEIYKLALRFYKAVQLSYKDRIKLVAYTKQVLYGKYRTDVSPEVGFLDVVGNDRRQAWMSLGDISRSEAMSEFIKYLDQLCPLFLPYVDAHKAEKEEQLQKQKSGVKCLEANSRAVTGRKRLKDEEERLRREEEEKERIQVEDEVRRRQEDDRTRQMQQESHEPFGTSCLNPGQCPVVLKRLIISAQFSVIRVTQTVPVGNAGDVQEVTQVAQAVTGNGIDPMTAHGAQVLQNNLNDPHAKSAPADGGEEENEQNSICHFNHVIHHEVELMVQGLQILSEPKYCLRALLSSYEDQSVQLPPLVPASIWTRKDLKSFKEMVRKTPENVIKIGSLATATVSCERQGHGNDVWTLFHTVCETINKNKLHKAVDSICLSPFLSLVTVVPSVCVFVDLPPIAAASMWTRKDVKEFKESIRKDPDSLIKVGSGETITVRVPTHEDGTCLFWEFATDSYDIGFGVYFEWTIAPNNQVSVHVSESSDEDELDEEEGESRGGDGDVERGKKSENRPPTDEIIPVYRRDCHQEVYCGSHMYPGRGVYLLKFDNSYSLWRSKCLYYRVYYTR
ncbi:hypothetical protein LSH36_195g06048 [Paralvinella palmiformis]|uniref:Golgi resident protein GCP60 n=1 Tax=Paralvinella palmiformis TaxID=53620 RepID=A0AAD9JPX1_9ANNE|nr:hypothetical protein LSH36_195g06048 [Paralvinella palmiformis]